MSRLTGKSTEKRNAANPRIETVKSTEGKAARKKAKQHLTEVPATPVTDQPRSCGLNVLVCSVGSGHGWTCMGLRQTRNVRLEQRSDVFQCVSTQLFEGHTLRRCGATGSRRSQKLPAGSSSVRSLEQLTSAGLARSGRTDLEKTLQVTRIVDLARRCKSS